MLAWLVIATTTQAAPPRLPPPRAVPVRVHARGRPAVPRAVNGPRGPVLLLLPGSPAVIDSGSFGQTPEPTRPPALPYVPAEPVRTSIGEPGRLTPMSELPNAFVPIETAPNRLPVTRIRPAE